MMEANQRVIKDFAHRDALSSATASSAILLTLEAVKDMHLEMSGPTWSTAEKLTENYSVH